MRSSHEERTVPGASLREAIEQVGRDLAATLHAVVMAVCSEPTGPAELGRMLHLDKVLCSRVLKAIRNENPIAVAFHAPGPEPLRRLLAAAERRKINATCLANAAGAVNNFDRLIRDHAGDRGSLHAIISGWLPEARRQFEKTRLQAAFKAMSQIKGACADISLATAILHPSSNGNRVDLAWIVGSLGLHRLRPGAAVKFTSRRLAEDARPRHAITLRGEPVESLDGLRVQRFCSEPPVTLDVQQVGDRVHYTLGETGYGPRAAVDLVFAEVNVAELPREVPPDRKGYVFTEVNTPSKLLHFDVLVHEEIYEQYEPDLIIYDTAFEGVANANDPAREIDRFHLDQSIEPLGNSLRNLRASGIPKYHDLLADALATLRWPRERFRGYRCRIEYPIYGSQVVVAFQSPAD